MDYTKFTTEELEKLLKESREKLIKMVMISGLDQLTEDIRKIEFTLKERKEDGE